MTHGQMTYKTVMNIITDQGVFVTAFGPVQGAKGPRYGMFVGTTSGDQKPLLVSCAYFHSPDDAIGAGQAIIDEVRSWNKEELEIAQMHASSGQRSHAVGMN